MYPNSASGYFLDFSIASADPDPYQGEIAVRCRGERSDQQPGAAIESTNGDPANRVKNGDTRGGGGGVTILLVHISSNQFLRKLANGSFGGKNI